MSLISWGGGVIIHYRGVVEDFGGWYGSQGEQSEGQLMLINR